MTFINSIAARIELVLPKSFTILNLLSFLLICITLVLPVVSSLIVLGISTLVQAVFFRVMHREKAPANKLLTRLTYLVVSAGLILIILFQHNLV